jgi:Cu-Zn family superoxide dismutase
MRRALWIAFLPLFACGGSEPGDAAPDGAPDGTADSALATASTATVDSVRAQVVDASGRGLGAVILSDAGAEIELAGALIGLAPGEHGFHIHAVGRCEPPGFESAGAHLSPEGVPHGFMTEGGPHPGDLRNLVAGEDSIATVDQSVPAAGLGGGVSALLDEDGSALVVHALPDDYSTQPAGGSGDRVACGVIE